MSKTADARHLLDSDLIARGEALGVYARGLVEGVLSGEHRSPYRGAAVEFSEHREYVAGDDLRRVDWRVLARSDRMYVKQYDQDTNFTAHVVLDASGSMGYGSVAAAGGGTLTKLEVGRRVAAALAYWVVRQGDAASAVVFGEEVVRVVPKTGSMAGLHSILTALAGVEAGGGVGRPGGEPSPGGVPPTSPATDTQVGGGGGGGGRRGTRIGRALHEVAEKNARKGLVFVVSDFLEGGEGGEAGGGGEGIGGGGGRGWGEGGVSSVMDGVSHLAFGGHEVVAFHVMDPAELSFPFRGDVELEGMEGEGRVIAQAEDVRRAYVEEVEAFCGEVRAGVERMRGQYVLVNTGEPLAATLGGWLAHRRTTQRGAGGGAGGAGGGGGGGGGGGSGSGGSGLGRGTA